MESFSSTLNTIIDEHLPAFRSLSRSEYDHKPSPTRWSKKEILGHLVDSAQNNIRRFIVAQYEHQPKIIYNQDKWVSITQYQDYDPYALIDLWYFINKHFCQVVKTMTPAMLEQEVQTEALHTLEWLAEDYIKHLRHHVHQVLDLEPILYP
jgi:hypothetical protein